MILFWRIRYLDTRDKQFKDRDLWLDTRTLDPATRAAVELCDELRDAGNRREMLKYRHLFHEGQRDTAELNELVQNAGRFASIFIPEYFEDENGAELSGKRMAVTMTGSPTAIMLPPGAKQHDIDLIFAEKRPIQLDQVTISAEQLAVLGYFARDLKDVIRSAFYKDGPGELTTAADGTPIVQTAVTDDEISSFVMTFRRLYMEKEPANFNKAVAVFGEVLSGHPIAAWVKGIEGQYIESLAQPPDFVPYAGQGGVNFTRKRLIDVYLYTKYAHQPDAKRARQYAACLESLGGRKGLLLWLFLVEMKNLALHMLNAGAVIIDLYDRYCQFHGITPTVIQSVIGEHPTVGTLEKQDARRARVMRERTERLAHDLWRDAGSPEGGPGPYIQQARACLEGAMTPTGTRREVTS